ncbi:MAG: hypothetical protein D6675_16705 [Gemmatimonadetes bacterium]|nr:MAG: hypothetical protein D6675_16705 [Gemmatimonadota bacterium]
MIKVKSIYLNNHPATIIQTSQDEPPHRIVQKLDIPSPRAVLVLNGGTAKLDENLQEHLRRLLQEGVAKYVAEHGVVVVTGATDAGIFSIFGEGLHRYNVQTPCIGVAVKALVTWKGRLPRWLPHQWLDNGREPLEPHHTHFVLVDGKNWGDETEMMYRLVQELSQNCPSLAIFAGGGTITLGEMELNVSQQRQMILIEGSGRTTDSVVEEHSGISTVNPRFTNIAKKGRISIFSLQDNPEKLEQMIHHLLFS